MEQFIWVNSIKEILFDHLSEFEYEQLMNDITEYLDYGITKEYKKWATTDYINELMIMFISLLGKIDNPHLLFFALLFKFAHVDNISKPDTSKINLEFFDYFLQEDRTFDLHLYSKGTKFLMSEDKYEFNDMVSENDFNIFNDIIAYFIPVEVITGVRFVSLQPDSPYLFQYSASLGMDNDKINSLILPALDKMFHKSYTIHDQGIKQLYQHKIHTILDSCNKLKKGL